MQPEVVHDEASGEYRLVANIDGVQVIFATVQGTYVDSLKANAEQAQQQQPGGQQVEQTQQQQPQA